MDTIDCRGMVCPKPLIATKKALSAAAQGEYFAVRIDNETSLQNVQRFCRDNGCESSVIRDNDCFVLTVHKKTLPQVEKNEIDYCESRVRSHVVCFKSDAMGVGPAELGAILMKAFVNTIKDCSPLPAYCVFYNTGVNLVVHGSALVEPFQNLEKLGVKILACGTCLDYFQIKDKLAVGSVSNMFTILETLNAASHVITP